MRKRIFKAYYGWRLGKAIGILEKLASRHRDAGHEVYFKVTGPDNVHFTCAQCPEYQPLKRKGADVVHISRDSHGRPYNP